MPFPDSPRVFYSKNPLEEVVCQLRFPPILRVDADAPVAFQDRVRSVFPLYRRSVTASPLGFPAGTPQQIIQMMAGAGASTHEFLSSDEVWKVSLTRDYLALTTSRYRDWQDFKMRLAGPLAALTEIYAPAFFQRIGLRYRDKIDRNALGLAGVGWSELLQPAILGELGDIAVGPYVRHVLRELIVGLTVDSALVRILHGLDPETQAYIIDGDFFVEKQIAIEGGTGVLDEFNKRAGRLFRWCITSKLHVAMEPRSA